MQSDRHIKRLARELDLPDQADLVIQRQKYWTASFCWLFFDRCDALTFEDPHAGLAAAQVAPELVSLTERFSQREESLAPLKVRGLAVFGSACRACGDLEQADDIYAKAFMLLKLENIPATEQANLFFRLAALRYIQGKPEKALNLANESVKIYDRADDHTRMRHLGEALSVRGWIYSTER